MTSSWSFILQVFFSPRSFSFSRARCQCHAQLVSSALPKHISPSVLLSLSKFRRAFLLRVFRIVNKLSGTFPFPVVICTIALHSRLRPYTWVAAKQSRLRCYDSYSITRLRTERRFSTQILCSPLMNPVAYFSHVYNQPVFPDQSCYQPRSSGKTHPPGIYVDPESYFITSLIVLRNFSKNVSN